jgi:4-amino-4-deoxy-L-arabinose transferase-like glycosyltransferase
MRRVLRSTAVEAALFAVLSIFLLSGVDLVPFHPDESSLLFQSRDLEALVTGPLSMAWTPGNAPTPEMTYRLLNAPLAKYVLGVARRLAGYGPDSVSVDWDWSKSWGQNVVAGALPPAPLLHGARTASTVALLGAVIALYLAGRKAGGRAAGLAAALLFGLNALSLLHGRRAMAEGTMLFGVAAATLGLLAADRRPFLAGLAVALAVNAKTSTLPLLLIGWLATVWTADPAGRSVSSQFGRTARYAIGVILLTAVLQPALWRHPLGALQAMWDTRRDLLARQVEDIQRLAPDHVAADLPQRSMILVANLYLAPLQYSEVGNYLVEQRASVQAYESNVSHTLLRGFVGGGLLLGLTLLGMIWALRRARLAGPDTTRFYGLLGLATVFQGLALVSAIPLPFQRYTLPLLPFLCLWQGLGLVAGVPRTDTKRRPA